jgi:hypothetical protein
MRVTDMTSGGAQASASRRRDDEWDEDGWINEENKRTGGQMQIGMGDN